MKTERAGDGRVAWTMLLLALGVLLVAAAVLVHGRHTSTGSLVVIVNGVGVQRARFDAEASTVGAYSPAARKRLLAYLVEEELLVQRALEIGLVESDQQLRRLIVRRSIDTLTRGTVSDGSPVASSRLWEFYRAHPELSERGSRFAVQAVRLQGDSAALSAMRTRMSQRMRDTGDSLVSVTQSDAVSHLDIPTRALGASELEPYLGADGVSRVMEAHAGDLLSITADNGHSILVQVLDVKMGPPGLQWPQQLGAIESAYRMAQSSRALCVALKARWHRTEIWVEPQLRGFVKSEDDSSCEGVSVELKEAGG